MFDLDFGKMLLVGAVALVVVGPKDLPHVLRSAGKILSKARRLRDELRRAATNFAEEADLGALDAEGKAIEQGMRAKFAPDPAMTMRGRASAGPDGESSAAQYASPEMAAYLAPPTEPAPIAPVDGSRALASGAGVIVECVPNPPPNARAVGRP